MATRLKFQTRTSKERDTMTGVQENLLPRSVTFATCALIVFVLVFVVIGIHTYGDEPEEDAEEGGERRKRRCRTVRGCFTYFRKTSSNLPLWKSLLLKFGVVLVTTLGSTCVSLVINNASANQEETIKQTIAEILNFDSEEYEDQRRKRETCVDTNESSCWQERVDNMIDRPDTRWGENLCDTINGWGDTIDPLFCTLFVAMVIFVLMFICCLMVPVVAFFLLGPAFKALKADEISNAVVKSIRSRIDRIRTGHREFEGGAIGMEETRRLAEVEATSAPTMRGLSIRAQPSALTSTTTTVLTAEGSLSMGTQTTDQASPAEIMEQHKKEVSQGNTVDHGQAGGSVNADDIQTSD